MQSTYGYFPFKIKESSKFLEILEMYIFEFGPFIQNQTNYIII